MNFSKGQAVTIRAAADIKAHAARAREAPVTYPSSASSHDRVLAQCEGRQAVVTGVYEPYNAYTLDVDGETYFWYDFMLEKPPA
jgi:hypothetical protein